MPLLLEEDMVRKRNLRALALALGFCLATVAAAQKNPLGVPVDITLWGGLSTFDAPGIPRDSKSGLRFAEFAVIPNANWRYWAKYDNSLTLDNFTFTRGGDTGEAYYLGGQYHKPQAFQMLAEAGIRHLENDVDETIARAEYVAFRPGATHLKLGAWIGDREDNHTEWMAYAGYGFPVSDNFRLEPTFFYSRTGFGDEDQWRILLAADHTMRNNLKLNAGFAFGRQKTFTGNNDYVGGHVILEIPMSGSSKAFFLVKREQSGDQNLWNVALGVTIAIR